MPDIAELMDEVASEHARSIAILPEIGRKSGEAVGGSQTDGAGAGVRMGLVEARVARPRSGTPSGNRRLRGRISGETAGGGGAAIGRMVAAPLCSQTPQANRSGSLPAQRMGVEVAQRASGPTMGTAAGADGRYREVQPANTVLIMSDEHNRNVLGCYGNPWAKTPNLDRIAGGGALYRNAYCNSPGCVPSRASMITGRYPHQTRLWDSATPYCGAPKGWNGRLRDAGHEVVSIGKLHFRSAEDDNGFSREIAPMHVHEGVGFPYALLRDPPVRMPSTDEFATQIGRGESTYTKYDRSITRHVCDWIAQEATKPRGKPWTLFVGYVAPHYPLIAPEEYYDLYDGVDLPSPRQYEEEERPRHPVIDAYRYSSNMDDYFTPETVPVAIQAYYGLCSFLDHNVGLILEALAENGLMDSTRVIYTSDHGESLGNRGMWGKSVMYDDSAAVPLMMAGPEIPAGVEVKTPVSLVDLHPTLTEFAGEERHPDDSDLPGESLTARMEDPEADRRVFSEYHDWSSITGMYMFRTLPLKIVRYPGYEDQVFFMEIDPLEEGKESKDARLLMLLNFANSGLRYVVDTDAVHRMALEDLANLLPIYLRHLVVKTGLPPRMITCFCQLLCRNTRCHILDA